MNKSLKITVKYKYYLTFKKLPKVIIARMLCSGKGNVSFSRSLYFSWWNCFYVIVKYYISYSMFHAFIRLQVLDARGPDGYAVQVHRTVHGKGKSAQTSHIHTQQVRFSTSVGYSKSYMHCLTQFLSLLKRCTYW